MLQSVEQQNPGAEAGRTCDPVSLEIIRGAIAAAQSEMEALLERTAISAFIREKKDFYT
ncbi:MAG: hydantoinase B/oxoprolinase family protein, partial [Nitratireductor sp.]